MSLHTFDQAIALETLPDGQQQGHTSPIYWNMVGPFGGITAAIVTQAVMRHPERLGEPLALTINYAAAIATGPFRVNARPARTNRSTQHWLVELWQDDEQGRSHITTTATLVTAVRRETFADSDVPMPTVPPPLEVPSAPRSGRGVAWFKVFDRRVISGDFPQQWDGRSAESTTLLWMRDEPPRPLDYPALASLADLFFPRLWLRRATFVPAGTVSMTVYFHADAATLTSTGSGHVLGRVRGQGFRHGYFDHTGQLWNEAGLLLATTHQVVYFKA